MDLTTAYPLWFTVFCLLAGAGYGYVLYRFDQRVAETSPGARWGLGILRALIVALIAFFLLKPFVRHVDRRTENPVVVFVQDNSESLRIGKDSTYYLETYPGEVDQLRDRLSDAFEVESYSFGKDIQRGLSFSFTEKETDISSVFREIENRYANRNLGAVILATDGIYNRGSDPRYTATGLNAPVYTVALGDTTERRDLLIKEVAHNRLAYLGNRFPLEVVVKASRLEGVPSTLMVLKEGDTLHQERVEPSEDSYLETFPVKLEAEETGLQHYKIKMAPVENEVSYVNNQKDVFIDVLDSRQRILILADAPHPDLAALRHGIESKEQYEVEVRLAANYSGGVDKYDLVVLHQLPSVDHTLERLGDSLRDQNKPRLFIYGGNTDLNRAASLGGGLTIEESTGKMNEVSPLMNPKFTLFQLDKEARNAIGKMPPLFVPFGEYGKKGGMETLVWQEVGNVETTDPLIGFAKAGNTKTGVIGGEGIWRWKIYGYAETNGPRFFNDLITKFVQYLAAKEDRSYFRVSSRNDFQENERIIFKAELYNKSYELVNEPDVMMTVTDQDGREYPFSFSRTGNRYRLDAGHLPVGEYDYTARTVYNEKEYTESGAFSVSPVQVERSRTVADHQMLYQLARDQGGEMVYPNDLGSLAEKINNRPDISPVTYSQERLSDLVNLKWLFFLILALITGEWVIRKWNGGY